MLQERHARRRRFAPISNSRCGAKVAPRGFLRPIWWSSENRRFFANPVLRVTETGSDILEYVSSMKENFCARAELNARDPGGSTAQPIV
jgi:hypothetical protein